MNIIRLILAIVLLAYSVGLAGDRQPIKPSKQDKCPVCGMFVTKYPDFLAQIIFKDGSYQFFDGVKDMFKYYFNIKRYTSSKSLSEIAALYVTSYYDLNPTDGRNAWYVIGSDVYGPMGKELIPFGKEQDAKEFMKDHSGETLLHFGDITPEMIKGLD